jgi:hypothetical protein
MMYVSAKVIRHIGEFPDFIISLNNEDNLEESTILTMRDLKGHDSIPPRPRGSRLFQTALTLAVMVIGSAHASLCDGFGLTPTLGLWGYQQRDARCEGTYVSPMAITGYLEIVSLTQGELRFDLAPGTRLNVATPEITKFTRDPINVRATAIPARVYYRMDAILPSHGGMIWPVDDVLHPMNLTADRIGVYGWTGTEREKLFIPLTIKPEGSHPLFKIDSRIRLKLRTSVDIDKVLWRIFSEKERLNKLPRYVDTGSGSALASRPIELILPEGKAGIFNVEIAAKRHDRDTWIKLKLRLIRPSQ